jgi:hypothetical protein
MLLNRYILSVLSPDNFGIFFSKNGIRATAVLSRNFFNFLEFNSSACLSFEKLLSIITTVQVNMYFNLVSLSLDIS